MQNAAANFDTLQYAKRLQTAGFTAEQAEIQAETLKGLIDDKLATKADIRHLESGIAHLAETTKLEIARSEEATKLEIQQVKLEIARSEEATKLEIHQLEERITSRFNEVDHRINEMGYKAIIALGSIMVTGIVALGVVIKLV